MPAPIKVYHSCDPPHNTLLLHFKCGLYTPPPGWDPPREVLIPKRHRRTEKVLRCPLQHCQLCADTRDEVTDLTLDVATSHNIKGVLIKPTEKKDAASRLADGVARGRLMFALPWAPDEWSQMLLMPRFSPQAAEFPGTLKWLYEVPLQSEVESSQPRIQRDTERANNLAKIAQLESDVVGEKRLAVGSEWSDFEFEPAKAHAAQSKPTASSRVPQIPRQRPVDSLGIGLWQTSFTNSSVCVPATTSMHASRYQEYPGPTTAHPARAPLDYGMHAPPQPEKRMLEDAANTAQARRKRSKKTL